MAPRPAAVATARQPHFEVACPRASDAPRIAEIHLAAMNANPLLHAQFPTPASRAALQRFLEGYTAEQLRDDPAAGVLVARDLETGVVMGFVKWDSPGQSQDVKLESGELRDLEGCRREFLDGYAKRAGEAKKRCFGERECYSLSFVCTDPAYQGRGAGSLLTQRVLDMAAADGLPVYLESTDVAVPMYKKLGFEVIDGFEMRIPRPGSESGAGADELIEVYREACMVWYPPSEAGGRQE